MKAVQRKNVVSLKPYTCARDLYKKGLFFDANENYRQWVRVNWKIISQLNRYPDSTCDLLRKKLCQKYVKGFKKENIFIGNGSDEIISLLIDGFVEENESILVMNPTYAVYEIAGIAKNRKVKKVLLNRNFSLNIARIRKSIERTKVMFLCSPNNPTGNLITRTEVEQIMQFFTGLIVIDEAYIEFAGLKNSLSRLVKTNKQLIILRTFSKAWGLAAIRVGYAIANPEIIKILVKMKNSYNVSSIGQEVALQALDQVKNLTKNISDLKKIKSKLGVDLKSMGIEIIPTQTNFVLAQIPNATQIYQQLAQQKIIVRDRSMLPYLKNILRITVGSKFDSQKLLQNLRRVLFDGIIWDMDGVLVDVSNSYRRAILETTRLFCPGVKIDMNDVDQIKSISGFNNDWDATSKLIEQKINRVVNYEKIKKVFQENYQKFADDEKLLISKSQLTELKSRYKKFGIATGRPRNEAFAALSRNTITDVFDTVITLEDTRKGKPNPEPLFKAAQKLEVTNPLYIGDTINDREAAKSAGMQFIDVRKIKNIMEVL